QHQHADSNVLNVFFPNKSFLAIEGLPIGHKKVFTLNIRGLEWHTPHETGKITHKPINKKPPKQR
ncbi:hypothetical protein, partial [Pseudomonas syringae group genomosp. 7]|uniref:hypothetical protein n=1 Tax=Pseudomonas syringae group genomosp. 7 TaxID=251699 RepID=UPI0037706223